MYNDEERAILDLKPGITDWASIWNSNEAAVLEGSKDPEKTYEELIRPTKLALQLFYGSQSFAEHRHQDPGPYVLQTAVQRLDAARVGPLRQGQAVQSSIAVPVVPSRSPQQVSTQ